MNNLPLAILISGASIRDGEASLLVDLFEIGLQRLHLRKPDCQPSEVAGILNKIPEAYHNRIVIHRFPELLKDFTLAGYHHYAGESLIDCQGTRSRSLHRLDELKDLNKIRGNVKEASDLFSSIFRDADPYLTSAKNHINGSYDLWLGTPGRQADVNKRVNGTTHTSVSLNNSHFAEKVARDTFKKNNPNATQEQIDNAAMIFRREQNSGKGDTGSLVADHISYAGTLTQEVHGDDCKLVTGDHALTVDGNYYLKVTGDCHLEVGGGFFLSAEGAPKKGGKIQKHAIKFGSDVDMSVVGAKLHFQSSELDLSATKTRITGRYYENTSDSQTYSGMEVTLQSQNSIHIVTPHLLELIGVEDTGTKKLRGKRTITVGGNETRHFHTGQTLLYEGYRISLSSNRSLYNNIMDDGALYEVMGDSDLRYETTA